MPEIFKASDAGCDESLNKMTKSKQLDLHIRYWVDDHVQSRYLGSQFMGHATAVDLLKHFKVSFYKSFSFYNLIKLLQLQFCSVNDLI